MRAFAGFSLAAAAALAGVDAHAADPVIPDRFEDRLVLETGRIPVLPPSETALTFSFHGEYQMRFYGQSDLPLEPPLSHPKAKTLGQNEYLYHWLRLSPAIRLKDYLGIVAQFDVPRGLIAGDYTQFVGSAREPLDSDKWYQAQLRYLYLEVDSPLGLFRVGQQSTYWGMGLVANDADHPSLFGDYRGGSFYERFLFATTPLGKGTPLVLAAAGDYVLQDWTANAQDGDRAFQGTAVALWRTKPAEIGVYGVVRHQEHPRQATGPLTPFDEELTVGVVDVAGKFHTRLPREQAFVYGEMEGAAAFGFTNAVRGAYLNPADPRSPLADESIRSFGGAATLGMVHVRTGTVSDGPPALFGNVVVEMEMGYASGDANPFDGVTKRFTFDPNHNVGLILFKQVMGWKTARAAVAAADPGLVARPAPGLQLLPSNGGVFGAEYVNPRFVYRPVPFVDLKTGVVIAQTTSDFVDPYHIAALGSPENYDGGDARKHDLGVEIDLGAQVRYPIGPHVNVEGGVEGGVFFPGHAFDDAAGHGMANQYQGVVKLGLQF